MLSWKVIWYRYLKILLKYLLISYQDFKNLCAYIVLKSEFLYLAKTKKYTSNMNKLLGIFPSIFYSFQKIVDLINFYFFSLAV